MLRMRSRDMEYVVGLLKNSKDAGEILSVRQKLNMAFLARTTDLSGKLPVLAFGATFRKSGNGIQLRRYNGYVLLEVNGLESLSEAEAVRREAAALPQTLLAFVGLSGRSVKVVVPLCVARWLVAETGGAGPCVSCCRLSIGGAALPTAVGQYHIVEGAAPFAWLPDECGSGCLLQSGCGGYPDGTTVADAGRR